MDLSAASSENYSERSALDDTAESIDLVSGRFLTDLFRALERKGIPAIALLGDLPIRVTETGQVLSAVEWPHFADFMRRLSNEVGGLPGLEQCGEMMGSLAPTRALSGLVSLTTSPTTLYRTAAGWVLTRALPGLSTELETSEDGRVQIQVQLADGLTPCPELFHLAVGGARVLPKALGLGEAVVHAQIEDRQAVYHIVPPPSPTLLARLRRIGKTIFSSGSVLRYLEAQQLELHAKNLALQKANTALAESESRFRAITDTAVDVLCEVDSGGRVVYVSAAIEDLTGYSPSQVTGSHYRLWMPKEWHQRVDTAVRYLAELPEGHATKEEIELCAHGNERAAVELTARSYRAPNGERRLVCILRSLSESAHVRVVDLAKHVRSTATAERPASTLTSTANPISTPTADDPDHEAPAFGFPATAQMARAAEDAVRAVREAIDLDLALPQSAPEAETPSRSGRSGPIRSSCIRRTSKGSC